MANGRSLTVPITIIAGILAVIALALRGDARHEPARQSVPQLAGPPRGAPDSYPSNDSAIAAFGAGKRLLSAYLGIDETRILERSTRRRTESLSFLIVTLPDPYDSHLDWMYDAHLDALRRAFADLGFVPDRFSLSTARDSMAINNRRIANRECHPGALLFRSSKALWLVYVVYELPTAGITKCAFRAALNERSQLLREAWRFEIPQESLSTLLILGPTFSGSAPSLRTVLQDALEKDSSIDMVRIVTGSATSIDSTLARNIAKEAQDSVRVSVAATVHSDDTMIEVVKTLMKHLGSDSTRFAILTEAQTAYGEVMATRFPGSPVIQFPLNIASLRTEMERSEQVKEAARGLPGLDNQRRTVLSLEQTTDPREAPALTSRLTVPTLDAVLRDVERSLTGRTGVVLITATDVRDKLMLASALRHRMRDVKFVLLESNMLLLRREYRHALKGALLVSTYPLIPEGEGWIDWIDSLSAPTAPANQRGSSIVHHRPVSVFGHDLAVGVFNAAVSLIAGPSSRRKRQFLSTPQCSFPPVWVSVVGGSSLFPIWATYPGTADYTYILPSRHTLTPPDSGEKLAIACNAALDTMPAPQGSVLSPARLRSYLLVFGPVAGTWGLVIALCWRWRNLKKGNSALIPRRWLPAVRSSRELHAAAFWLLSMVPVCGGIAVVGGIRELGTTIAVVYAIVCFVPVVALLLGWYGTGRYGIVDHPDLIWFRGAGDTPAIVARSIRWLPKSETEELNNQRDAFRNGRPGEGENCDTSDHEALDSLWYRLRVLKAAKVAAGLVAFALAILSVGWVVAPGTLAGLDASLLHYRTADLLGGASPASTIILVGLSLTLWYWWQHTVTRELTRPSAFEIAMKDVARSFAGSSLLRSLGHHMWRARSTLVDYLPDESAFVALTVIVVGALVFGIWLDAFGPSLESMTTGSGAWWYEAATYVGLLAVAATIAIGLVRFTTAWQALDTILEVFSGTRMMSVFKAIPTDIVMAARPALLGEQSWRAPGFGIRPHPRPAEPTEEPADWRPRALENSERKAFEHIDNMLKCNEPPTLERLKHLGEALDLMGMFGEAADKGPEDEEQELSRGARQALCTHFALEIGFFVARIMFALRRLAWVLLVSMLLAVLLITSYPFHAQGLIRFAVAALMIWALASFIYVIAKMSYQQVLHEIAQTGEGASSWGLTVAFNVVVFAVLPMLGYLATEIPTVRTFLVAWIEPVTRALAR